MLQEIHNCMELKLYGGDETGSSYEWFIKHSQVGVDKSLAFMLEWRKEAVLLDLFMSLYIQMMTLIVVGNWKTIRWAEYTVYGFGILDTIMML